MTSSYSVEAIISAVDKGFSRTMRDAEKAAGGLGDSTQKANTSIWDIAKGVGVFKIVEGGVNMVKNSVDGAISRFDTLNKYPTVMQALGHSAEDVDKSMEKMNKGIDGLPTSLDEIVASTQQLAIATGDLEKGTDTAIALNDAFLASGASTADASRGAQQYIQMLSKGEADLQSWRTLQETMPIAMDKVAKSFEDRGVKSVNELYDALKDGRITFDEFNDRLIELDQGVGGFAELAQKNSKGIATSWKNIQTAVVKGVEKTIRAIDEGMQDAGMGSIAENFDKIKGVVNNAFDAIVQAVPPVLSALQGIWNVIKPFMPVILTIIGYITTYQAVMGTAKKAVQLYTGAQELMNMAMKANPVGLLISAIVLLVGAVIYLWNTNEDFRNAVIEIWTNIKNFFVNIWTGISETAKSIWNGIKQFFSDTWDGIKSGAEEKWTGLKTWLGSTWDGLKEKSSNTWENVKTTTINKWEETKKNVSNTADKMVSGLNQAWENMKQGVSNTVEKVKGTFDKLKEIDLWEIGKAIIDGFVKGLKSAWEAGENFIGGIGSWIKKNKGPIEKDKKLLIPAGRAIMGGFNKALTGGFDDVERNVVSMADRITDLFNNSYSVDIGASLARASQGINTEVTHQVNYGANKQPMQVNLVMGNQTYQAFVDDISNAQGAKVDLEIIAT